MMRAGSMDLSSQEPVWEMNWSWDAEVNEEEIFFPKSWLGKGRKIRVVTREKYERLQPLNNVPLLIHAWFIKFENFLCMENMVIPKKCIP
jgi:hypothetical protein